MITEQRINEIIDALRGSARSLLDVATEEEESDDELTAAIDDQLFECRCCGWWCEMGSENCTECADENPHEETCTDCCTEDGHGEG